MVAAGRQNTGSLALALALALSTSVPLVQGHTHFKGRISV